LLDFEVLMPGCWRSRAFIAAPLDQRAAGAIRTRIIVAADDGRTLTYGQLRALTPDPDAFCGTRARAPTTG